MTILQNSFTLNELTRNFFVGTSTAPLSSANRKGIERLLVEDLILLDKKKNKTHMLKFKSLIEKENRKMLKALYASYIQTFFILV